jgi:hypothetical protein
MYKILQWLGVYSADNNSEINTVDPVPSNDTQPSDDSTSENLNALGVFQKDLKNVLGKLEQFKNHWTKLLNTIPNEAKRSPRILKLESESKLEKFFEAAKSFVKKVFETPHAFIEDDVVEYRDKIAAVREELKKLEQSATPDDLKKASEKQAEHYLLHIKFCNLLIEFIGTIQADLVIKKGEIDLIDTAIISALKFVILYATGAAFPQFLNFNSVNEFTDALVHNNIKDIEFEVTSFFEEAQKQVYMDEKANQSALSSVVNIQELGVFRQVKKAKLEESKEEEKDNALSLQMS